jgi:hypothetical protein
MFQKEASMPTKTPIAKPETVDAFLESLQHPLKPAVLLLRQIFQQADPSINESIKWNVPSFSTSEYFATMHLRAQNRIGVILHFGAKKRDTGGITINDPESLLEWLAADRAQVLFHDLPDLEGKRTALTKIIRDWILHVR